MGLIGTNQDLIGDEVVPTERTTPSPGAPRAVCPDALRRLHHVVMEASSHALALDRVYGIHYAVGGHQPDPGPPGFPQDHGSLLRRQGHPVPELRRGRLQRRRSLDRAALLQTPHVGSTYAEHAAADLRRSISPLRRTTSPSMR